GAGQKVDVWQWKAARTNPIHIFDDQAIDENTRRGDGTQNDDFPYTNGSCTRKNSDGERYVGADTSATMEYFSNEYFDSAQANCPSLGPSRVPSPYASNVKAMFEQGSPFIGKNGGTAAKQLDGTVTPTTGDTIPGYIWRTAASTNTCVRCQNQAQGQWSATGGGKWVVEMRRSLVAPDGDDVDFTIVQH